MLRNGEREGDGCESRRWVVKGKIARMQGSNAELQPTLVAFLSIIHVTISVSKSGHRKKSRFSSEFVGYGSVNISLQDIFLELQRSLVKCLLLVVLQ
jgi:hypothetical protein